jgi:hypothetical protein
MVVGKAHWPAVGVKVYVTVPVTEVSIVAGDQVPEIPTVVLLEVVGKTGAVTPWHNGKI